jgi:DNA-binding transcriptional ArsR family regulator
MKLLCHPHPKDISLAGVLYALGDPIRLEIVKVLAVKGEQPCSGFDLGIAKSTMSHHFRVLRESGAIYCRKEGTQHLNSLRRQELDELFPGLLDAILQAASKMRSPQKKSLVN